MVTKITNSNFIQMILQSHPHDIKELVLDIKDMDAFLDTMLDSFNDDSDWPLAVNPMLIVDMNNPEECQTRARNIVDMIIDVDLDGLNVLDFGCGNGLTAVEMLHHGTKKVVGYDLGAHPFWQEESGLILTTNAQESASNGPYDVILLYDVLDHVVDEEPVRILGDLNKLLSQDGRMIVRNHPWIARHGTHLYTSFNRAFAHLIFDTAPLVQRGYIPLPTRKIIHPILTYKKWFEKAELKIIKEDQIVEPVEDFFLNNEVLKNLIQKHFNHSPLEEYREGHGDLSRILSFDFIDFQLQK